MVKAPGILPEEHVEKQISAALGVPFTVLLGTHSMSTSLLCSISNNEEHEVLMLPAYIS